MIIIRRYCHIYIEITSHKNLTHTHFHTYLHTLNCLVNLNKSIFTRHQCIEVYTSSVVLLNSSQSVCS